MFRSSPGLVQNENEGPPVQELLISRQQQKIKPSVRSFWAEEGEEGPVQVTGAWSWACPTSPQPNRKGIYALVFCHSFSNPASIYHKPDTVPTAIWGTQSRAVESCTTELESHQDLSPPLLNLDPHQRHSVRVNPSKIKMLPTILIGLSSFVGVPGALITNSEEQLTSANE